MPFDLFSEYNNKKLLVDLFQAYYDARSNKRNTLNALNFEMDYEHNLIELHNEIINGSYIIKPSICFINYKPVQREIFAADFRDRVVHHLVYNYIAPIFDKTFINDSYSCRKGKGTHYGIKRIAKFMRSCSQNYHKDCYILKLDIQGYFMAMNRFLLYEKVKAVIINNTAKISFDIDLLLYLIEKIIFNDPTKNCIIKGSKSDWNGMPKTKSLFYANANCGLPIGNLSSQLFGNVYMNDFDHFVKKDLGIKYYGRYVDDFILIHPSKEYLKWMISKMETYLMDELHLILHPKKIYLQHFSKGVLFLGTVIKPHCIYIGKRTKNNFYKSINVINKTTVVDKPNKIEKTDFINSMNSYLGILKHYQTYNLRKKLLFENLSGFWWEYMYSKGGYSVFVQKPEKHKAKGLKP